MEKQNEKCKVIFESEDGKVLVFNIVHDRKKAVLDIKLTVSPGYIKDHQGFYCQIANYLLDALEKA